MRIIFRDWVTRKQADGSWASEMKEVPVRIPKQWRHWCLRMGLYPFFRGTTKPRWAWVYLEGRGQAWQISMEGQFECARTQSVFDSRPNRESIYHVPIPQTEAEFQKAVLQLSRAHLFTSLVISPPASFSSCAPFSFSKEASCVNTTMSTPTHTQVMNGDADTASKSSQVDPRWRGYVREIPEFPPQSK